ncbi:cell division protein FtsL [Xanthobacter sp. ZOL 2024]
MFRVANIVMVGALLITAAVVYQLKYASTAEAERLATLRSQIRKEREVIGVLKAEWARRTSPMYIQGLVERHLDLKRLDVDSISDLASLPERPSSGNDGIGGIIEALEDAPLVTSSVSRGPVTPTAPGSGATGSTAPAASALRPPPSKPLTVPANTALAPRPSQARPVAPPRPAPPSAVLPPVAAPVAAAEPAQAPDAVRTFFNGFLSGR